MLYEYLGIVKSLGEWDRLRPRGRFRRVRSACRLKPSAPGLRPPRRGRWSLMNPSKDFPARDRTSYRLVDEARRGRARRTPMAVEVAVARRLFTREEYHRMGEVGILKPTDRVELIRGEIVKMSPIGRRHTAFVDNLNELLITRLTGRAIVSVQNPVALSDDTEPQPDLKVLRRRRPPYEEREAYA